MQRNLLHRQRALFLRKKKGYTYKEIMEEISVAKSTLSGWLSGIELEKHHQERIRKIQEERWSRNFNLGEWNRAKRQKEITEIRVAAKQEIGTMTDRELFIAGIMLYWAKGYKSGSMFGVANADPNLMVIMMHWFRKCLKISEDRFRASIHYHEGQDPKKIEEFWSKVTGIPLENFQKPFCKPPGTGHRKHYLQWGVLRVYVQRGSNNLQQVLAWKDGLINTIISGKNSR